MSMTLSFCEHCGRGLIRESERSVIHDGKDYHEECLHFLQYTNLCDGCSRDFGACKSTPVFGLGVGKDNVVGCTGVTR